MAGKHRFIGTTIVLDMFSAVLINLCAESIDVQICFVTPLRVVNGTVIDAATDCFAISGDCLVTNRRNNTIQLPNCSNWKFSRGAAVTATVLTALSMACFVLILVMRRKPKTRRLYRALMLLLQFTAGT